MITIKPMKLFFIKESPTTWGKRIEDLRQNIILEEHGNMFIEAEMGKEHFDDWEAQMKQIPVFNIVEVERFV